MACLPSISPMITDIINSSLTSGTVPSTLKLAAITPILKKPGSDPADLNHYRPISNLPLISKTLERVVAAQLQFHLDTNDLHEPFNPVSAKNTATKQPWLGSPTTSSVQLTPDLSPCSSSSTSVLHLTPFLTHYSWTAWLTLGSLVWHFHGSHHISLTDISLYKHHPDCLLPS